MGLMSVIRLLLELYAPGDYSTQRHELWPSHDLALAWLILFQRRHPVPLLLSLSTTQLTPRTLAEFETACCSTPRQWAASSMAGAMEVPAYSLAVTEFKPSLVQAAHCYWMASWIPLVLPPSRASSLPRFFFRSILFPWSETGPGSIPNAPSISRAARFRLIVHWTLHLPDHRVSSSRTLPGPRLSPVVGRRPPGNSTRCSQKRILNTTGSSATPCLRIKPPSSRQPVARRRELDGFIVFFRLYQMKSISM